MAGWLRGKPWPGGWPGGTVTRDQEATKAEFERLFDDYHKRVFNLILRLVGDPEDAADLTAETFLQALRGFRNFRGDSTEYTWLYRIAVNQCKNYFHSKSCRQRSRETVSLDQVGAAELADSRPGIEEVETRSLVSQAISSLPEELRLVVVLKDLHGLSYQEIAQVADCSQDAVRSRLFRARILLRQALTMLGVG